MMTGKKRNACPATGIMNSFTRLVAFTAFLVGITGVAYAQSLTASIAPLGSWALCETAPQYAGILCAGFVPGNEGFLLLARTDDPRVVAYRYSVSAVLVSTGATVTLTGVAERVDSVGGVYQTSVPLFFGGIAKDFQIKVDALELIGGQPQAR